MNKFRFLEWKVYADAQDLFSSVIKIVNQLPREYRFTLGDQIIRSSFSVLLNLAEGSGKATDKDLNRYLDIALGSLYEVLAALDTLLRNTLISEDEFEIQRNKISSIADQLGGFKKYLD